MFESLHKSEDWEVGRWHCEGHPSPNDTVREVAYRHEIAIPVRGTFLRKRAGEQTFASSVTAVMADAGDSYEIRHPVDAEDRCLVFLLDESALEDLGRTTGAVEGFSVPRFCAYQVPISDDAYLAAVSLFRTAGSREAVAVEGESADLLNRLMVSGAGWQDGSSSDDPATARRHHRAVVRVVALMAADPDATLTLDRISAEAGYSPFHFARIFRDVTGVSPHRYLIRFRLRRAAAALEDGEEDLSRLAFRTGFSSHSHMSSAFRRAFGLTPSEFRARF